MAIGVKEAVRVALDYVHALYGASFSDFMLEEAEASEDGKYWLITIGFSRPARQTFPLDAIAPRYERFYKVVKVDADTAEPISIKIRPT